MVQSVLLTEVYAYTARFTIAFYQKLCFQISSLDHTQDKTMQQIQGPKQECFDVLGKRLASFEHRDTILSDDLASRLQTGPVAGFPQMMVV